MKEQAFEVTLRRIREQNPELFDEAALRPPLEDELTEEVVEIDVPKEKELWDVQSSNENLPDLPDIGDWLEEGRDQSGSTLRAGVELLAIYLPFHFYPPGDWGIRFFERPIWAFADTLFGKSSIPISRLQMLKIATYSVARHEFLHYLVELEALDAEVKTRRRVYRPYWDRVYRPAYPGMDCLEETVANVWAWENPAIRSPVALRDLFRSEMRRIPWRAYAAGADPYDVPELEDRLNAQLLQCAIRPAIAPPVWGSLPRPYHQPWTRYENVSFTMDTSLGGKLGAVLNAGPLRKTIRIHHR